MYFVKMSLNGKKIALILKGKLETPVWELGFFI